MGVQLTKDDVFELLKSNDLNARVKVTKKICNTYTESLYSADEIEIAQQIFRILAKDAEVMVRATLSEALKLSNDLPHDIAKSLAMDVEHVAMPILVFSSVLTDSDLMEIIYNDNVQKMLAITRRKKISRAVAKTLADKQVDEVTASLLNNADFTNNTEVFEGFIEDCADNPQVMRAIVLNSSLPLQVTEKLLTEVSGSLLGEIKHKYHITPEKFGRYVSHSVEISLLAVIDHNSTDEDIEHLVAHLYNSEKLTPSLVLSSACMGRKRFFIAAIAKRAGIPIVNAQKIIEKGGPMGLQALLRQAGIPEKLFEAIELVIILMDEKKARDPDISVHEFCNWLIVKLEYFAEKNFIEYIAYMIAIAKQVQKVRADTAYAV